MEIVPSVLQVIPGDNFTVYAYFNDGSVRKADIKPLIEQGGVFSALADETFFRERLTVINGAAAWDVTGTRDAARCVDLDPCAMYEHSPVVKDPLDMGANEATLAAMDAAEHDTNMHGSFDSVETLMEALNA